MWGATGRINSLGPAVTLAGAPAESLYTQGNPPAPLSFRMSRAPCQVKGLHPPKLPLSWPQELWPDAWATCGRLCPHQANTRHLPPP